MKKISEYKLSTITPIQIAIATLISLLFQYVFPLTWQPLDLRMYGPNIKHGDSKMNVVIASVSQWYFSFSIAWLIYRDNPYINNFLIYSFGSVFMISFAGIFYYHLFWDFIHLFPLAVDFYLLWKKRDTLYQKRLPYYLIFISSWYYLVYFLHLAYFLIPLILFIANWLIVTIIGIAISFSFPDNIYSEFKRKTKMNSPEFT